MKMSSSSSATVEDVIEKIHKLEAGQTYLMKEMTLLNIWARGPPSKWALEGPKKPKSLISDPLSEEEWLMEAHYMNILESMGQAVFAFDLNRRVFYWNQHCERLFDCSREDALGNDILSIIVNPNHYGAAFDIINGVKRGARWTGQFPIELHMGKKLLAISSVNPFYDDGGTLVGLVSVAVDSKPFFEIQYSLPYKTATFKLTALAMKVRNKVRSKMKIGVRDVSATGHSGDNSRFSNHDDKNGESPTDTSAPIKHSIRSTFGLFCKGDNSMKDSNDKGEGKSALRKITSKAEAWIQKKAKQ